MITPADIQNKEFTKSIRGYDKEEVDMFLDLITLDLEKLMKENLNLKAQIATLEKDKDSIGGSDLTVRETLETAKNLMDDLAVSSEKRAKALVQNAEMDATIIIKDAKMKAEQVAEECAALTKSFENFKREYKGLLDRYADDYSNIVSNIDIDRLASLLKEKEESDTIVVEKVEDIVTEDNQVSLEEKIAQDAQSCTDDEKKTMIKIRYE